MLGQARMKGGLENETQIDASRAQIEALPHPPRGDRDEARVLNKEGLAMLNRGNISEATSKLKLAYTADPSDPEMAGNLGYAYLLARDLHQADAFLVYTIGIDPTRSSSWLKLGELFAAKGDLELAEAALAHAVRFSNSRSRTRLLLNRLAAAHPGTILDQAIRNVLEVPFPGFTR
jgi:Flp pilus assembly protein TadD